jgi:hypothetical protein
LCPVLPGIRSLEIPKLLVTEFQETFSPHAPYFGSESQAFQRSPSHRRSGEITLSAASASEHQADLWWSRLHFEEEPPAIPFRALIPAAISVDKVQRLGRSERIAIGVPIFSQLGGKVHDPIQQTNLAISSDFCTRHGSKVCQICLQNVKKEGRSAGRSVLCPLPVDMSGNC